MYIIYLYIYIVCDPLCETCSGGNPENCNGCKSGNAVLVLDPVVNSGLGHFEGICMLKCPDGKYINTESASIPFCDSNISLNYIYIYCWIDCTNPHCLCENGNDCISCKDGYLYFNSHISDYVVGSPITCVSECEISQYEENGECSTLIYIYIYIIVI